MREWWDDDRAPLTLLVWTALPTAAAALLAWALLFRERPLWLTLAVVGGAVAVGVLLAMQLVGTEPRRDTTPVPGDPRRQGQDGWWADAPPALPPTLPPVEQDRRPAEPERENAQLVLPVEGAERPGTWWNQDGPTAAPQGARPGALARHAPRDLAELSYSTRVVQCPRCGAFRVDVAHVAQGFAFRCRVDDHEWTWRPGTAWPVTVVASRRRNAR
jgi:hypothetical protein